MKITFCLTPILILLLFQGVSARGYMRRGEGYIAPWEFGVSGGVTTFLTSVNPTPGVKNSMMNYWHNNLNPGVALSVVRNLSPSLGIELSWLNSRLTGKWNDKWTPIPFYSDKGSPLTYDTQFNQLDLMANFNLSQIILPGDEEDPWHIFMKAGVGVAKIKDNKNFYPRDNPSIRFSFALDAGASVSLGDKIKLMVGSTFRSVNTDNLDGAHIFSTDTKGKTISYLNIFEIYNFSYLKVSYNFGNF